MGLGISNVKVTKCEWEIRAPVPSRNLHLSYLIFIRMGDQARTVLSPNPKHTLKGGGSKVANHIAPLRTGDPCRNLISLISSMLSLFKTSSHRSMYMCLIPGG